ncbi:MAG: hydrolase [Microcella sp.]|uniref:HAD family hydrolase n=1 Tax=Microcella sp. TaxID=1913979 RepID=UPI003315026A
MTRDLIILDFDGTVCLGDAPVLAYAVEVARAVGEPESGILTPLEAFLSGEARGLLAGCADGYSAVARWAGAHGLEPRQMGAAYHASREALESGAVDVRTPVGLEDFLQGFDDWERVLVTNAPTAGTELLVERLGLAPLLDRVIGDAGKPDGLRRFIAPGSDGDPRLRGRILSIGDIWRNDLEPVAHAATTALIERHPQPDARPTFRAARIEELYGRIAHWRASPTTRA